MPFETQPAKGGRAMRSPRPGLAWSTGRIHRRAAYCNYMASEQWFAFRERWAADWVERHGTQLLCLVCGVEWALCDDLHHRTYERLGREAGADRPFNAAQGAQARNMAVTEEGIDDPSTGTYSDVTRVGPSQRSSALSNLSEAGELLDMDAIAPPSHWPSLTVDEAAREWPALRSWVEKLMARFSHLDHHVIPRCWFLHNGHVEALVALRDQERVNYGETAPGTAGVDWHRAFKVRSLDSDEWDHFVNSDMTERKKKAENDTLAG